MSHGIGTYYEGLQIVQQGLDSVVARMGIDLRAPTPMTLYSQHDPQWEDEVYSGKTTFGAAGCYVCCVAMIASLAGSTDDPPTIAKALRDAGCFGAGDDADLLLRPELIPEACFGTEYHSTYRWHDKPADMLAVWDEVKLGPTIIEVDFAPGGRFNQHFVVAEAWDEETGGLQIADPWDGQRKELPAAYSPVLGGWSLERAIYGMRCLRVAAGVEQ